MQSRARASGHQALLRPAGSLRRHSKALAAATGLVLRPPRYGGSWQPDSKDLDCLRAEGRHLRYLELPAQHARGIEVLDRLEHLVLAGAQGPAALDLAALTRLRALATTWSRGLAGFEALRGLRSLSLHYCRWPDLSPLEAPLATLRSLTMKACRVADHALLARGVALEFLHVSASGRRQVPGAALAALQRLRLLHLEGIALAGIADVRLAASLAWVVLRNVGPLPSLRFLDAARPRFVSLGGRTTVLADGGLRQLLSRRPAHVAIEKWADHYDVQKADLPKRRATMPRNRHADPTGLAARA